MLQTVSEALTRQIGAGRERESNLRWLAQRAPGIRLAWPSSEEKQGDTGESLAMCGRSAVRAVHRATHPLGIACSREGSERRHTEIRRSIDFLILSLREQCQAMR